MLVKFFSIILLCLVSFLSTAEDEIDVPLERDPFEQYNRFMFTVNDKADIYILKPVAKAYNKVLPTFITNRVTNFFNNIDEIPTVVNDLLQANPGQAILDTSRFIINSTVGILGLFDPASRIGLTQHNEDFGLTLARWGYKNSNYFVIPLFGPSTIRDTLGFGVDWLALNPMPSFVEDHNSRIALYGLRYVNKRAALLRFQNVMQQAALDRYIFVRNVYLQRRNNVIQQNENPLPPC